MFKKSSELSIVHSVPIIQLLQSEQKKHNCIYTIVCSLMMGQ